MRKMILGLILLTGCSDANWAKWKALGQRHHVKCYSGGTVIYDGTTTGKIENEHQSDGYYFEDEATRKLVAVSGNCLITVE